MFFSSLSSKDSNVLRDFFDFKILFDFKGYPLFQEILFCILHTLEMELRESLLHK